MAPIRCCSCGGTGFVYSTDMFGDQKRSFCVDCNGTGYLNGNGGISGGERMHARCISCGGTGFYEYTDELGNHRRFCVDCKGTGYMIPGWGY